MLSAMLPGSDGIANVIRSRVDELQTFGAAAARPLVEEEEMLLQTARWYNERGAENSLVEAVSTRLQVVRGELEHVLPLWEEAQLLERVLRLYERQQQGEQDPGRLRIIRNHVRQQMDIDRRNAIGHPSEARGGSAADQINMRRLSAMRGIMAPNRDQAAVDEDGDETAVERTARSQSVQERVGRFAREYLDVTRVAEVPFTTLYEAVIDYAAREWPNSTERARIENFRYALRRAAPLFGLVYDQGRVRRAEPNGEGVSK
jgi:hypothetical protein